MSLKAGDMLTLLFAGFFLYFSLEAFCSLADIYDKPRALTRIVIAFDTRFAQAVSFHNTPEICLSSACQRVISRRRSRRGRLTVRGKVFSPAHQCDAMPRAYCRRFYSSALRARTWLAAA